MLATSCVPVMAMPNCATTLLAGPPVLGLPRLATADDLIGLRDLGAVDLTADDTGIIAPSPDGTAIAFGLRRADAAANRICVGLVVLPIKAGGKARVIDASDAVVRSRSVVHGIAGFVSGYAKAIAPCWSPDGRSIAWLKMIDGIAQVWRADVDERPATLVTHETADVTDFAWNPDGQTIIYTTSRLSHDWKAAHDAEALTGFVYDRRYWAVDGAQPRPTGPLEDDIMSVSANGWGVARIANARERALFDPVMAERPAGADLVVTSPDRRIIAWTQAADPANVISSARLRVRRDQAELDCPLPACQSGIRGLWWIDNALVFLREEREAGDGAFGFYRWDITKPAPVRFERTYDAFTGCVPDGTRLICTREGSLQPRRIVAIDPRRATTEIIYDPNPGFDHLLLGSVQRLRWRDTNGIDTFGDLVLPPDHRPGQQHPLIVVQYHTQGFLRGGTGDEYPIQLFAAWGYAVLVFEENPVMRSIGPVADYSQYTRLQNRDSLDRRRKLEALEAGVRTAMARGVIDADRIGITGLSDGAATVCYALTHSRMFKAAIISSGCNDAVATMTMVGPGYTHFASKTGTPFPGTGPAADKFWQDNGLSNNVDSVDTPLLVQAPDAEFRTALQSFATFREHGRPFELIVFPDEAHVKLQPAHRAALYARNLDWFDFWLRRIERPDADPAQYIRWRQLRGDAVAARAAFPLQPPLQLAAHASISTSAINR
jgi:dipeptidyl aminopeptidase/acylaminoacyl peptidase